MYLSVFDAKWRLESSLVLFLIKPVFLLILISDHENNKCICSSNMLLVIVYLELVQRLFELFKN